MTIISSISLGVCWFDLSLLICQTMLIGLTDRKIKCRSRNTSGKQENTGQREEPRVSEGRGVRSSLWHTSWVALKVSTGNSTIFNSKQLTIFLLSPVKWGSSLEYVTEISFSWELNVICVVVQSHVHVRLFETPWTHSTQGFPVLHSLPELAQTYVHWVGDAIQPSHPLSYPSPFLNLSQHQDLFQWISSLHQLAKVLELQLQYQSFQWISFRIDWFDLLAVQETLKSLLQHDSSKASILLCSAFFMVQLSHLYITTGKTIVLTIWTFAGKGVK